MRCRGQVVKLASVQRHFAQLRTRPESWSQRIRESVQLGHDAIDAALEAYDRLGLLGEDIEDEWTYVTDLAAAWRARLEAVDATESPSPTAAFLSGLCCGHLMMWPEPGIDFAQKSG